MEKILREILDKLNSLENKVNDLQLGQDDLKSGQNDLRTAQDDLKSGQKETYELVKALEYRTETISATLGNLENQLVHLSGDVKAIKTSTEKDQLYVLGRIAKCEKDIYELKQGAGL